MLAYGMIRLYTYPGKPQKTLQETKSWNSITVSGEQEASGPVVLPAYPAVATTELHGNDAGKRCREMLQGRPGRGSFTSTPQNRPHW